MAKLKGNFEPAIGFINVSVKQADGTALKLQKGIALRESNRTEKALFDFLTDNPDTEVQIVGKFNPVSDEEVVVKL